MSKQSEFIDYSQYPNAEGHFGPYGGRFVSETLIYALDELAEPVAAGPGLGVLRALAAQHGEHHRA